MTSMSNTDDTKNVAPDWGIQYDLKSLWTEVAEGLWVGGTKDEDTVSYARESRESWSMGLIPTETAEIGPEDFNTVVTLYAWARPADWFVEEYRWPIYDSSAQKISLDELRDLVVWTHKRWKNDKRVLIRCQAGLSRSPFITALVLIRDGMEPEDAVKLIKEKRSQHCLSLNGSKRGGLFSKILYDTEPSFWRN